jgi:TolB protein
MQIGRSTDDARGAGAVSQLSETFSLPGELARRVLSCCSVLFCSALLALAPAAHAAEPAPPPDESILGEFFITADVPDALTPIAVLPSLSPDLEDVMVRSVVRRDLEITGLFDLIADSRAPEGLYGFDDPVDVQAWQALGAQVIVKVAARSDGPGKVKIFGLCYFPKYGRHPVYEKTLVVADGQVRATAHRITDALLGAITGRNGSFSSHMTFSGRTAKTSSIYTVDADGHGIRARSEASDTSIAPVFGPAGSLFFSRSRKYSPFRLVDAAGKTPAQLPFQTSVYSAAFDANHSRLAVAVSNPRGSSVYVGNVDGSNMKKISTTDVAIHPAFSPSGKLAWIGGGGDGSARRVYVDGRAVSPAGFSASAPTFCDTPDGVSLVYAVAVGGGSHDLIMSNERGQSLSRLTQGEGSNTYPACSPDGRLIAFFSERRSESGLFVKSLKSGRTQKISSKVGASLRWAPLPE